MAQYRSIIAWAVSHLPSTADEARHAIYEQARTALHERLGNDPQISDAELVNEHFSRSGRGLVTERYASVCKRRDGLYLKDKGVRALGRSQVCPAEPVLTQIKDADCDPVVRIMSRVFPAKDAVLSPITEA